MPAQWFVRIGAGVTIGLILHAAPYSAAVMSRPWALVVVVVICFVAWFGARGRRRFGDDVRDRFFGGGDDDRCGGPPGYA